ncbi:phage baseplate assembly protein V [Kiloniella majae]|uniref:phage baseplate assembly protein V n=1 Tax=Kiloniella majae TaxID=1938558 RepID=UPI000A277909|nr:phage baseplate assembly protein V [Kiloniella majae]
MIEQFREIIGHINMRIRLLFTRGLVTVVYPKQKGEHQGLQTTGLDTETSDDIEHAEPYGLAAHPLAGAETFISNVLGQRSHMVALIVGDPRYRPTDLKSGEVKVWSKYGQEIHLRDDGGITITAPGGDLKIDAPEVNINTPAATINTDKAVINSDDIHLGGEGGEQVARITDMVRVGTGSSAGDWPIISGSDKVRAK